MSTLENLLNGKKGVAPAFEKSQAEDLARDVAGGIGGETNVYPKSLTAVDGRLLFLYRQGISKRLGVINNKDGESAAGKDLSGSETREISIGGSNVQLTEAPLTPENANWVQSVLTFTTPRTLGTAPAVGFGDRLGLATPGHVQSVVESGKGQLRPIYSQQSVRELTRTERQPEDVIAGGVWGVLEEGYRDRYGADADHLKSEEDIDRFFNVGFTFFTLDPSDHVQEVEGKSVSDLETMFQALPWEELESSSDDGLRRFADKDFSLEDGPLTIGREAFLRAAVKYGKAIANTTRLYRHLEKTSGEKPFEVELSVDETEEPTTIEEHAYIAAELQRLGVKLVSLAPRFVGRFEKGVDYIGDLEEFRNSFRRHAAVSKRFGKYKIGIHSGSDKFQVYPIAAELAAGAVHLKTAGTSYLEALRVAAKLDPEYFRAIFAFARDRYETDKASYHVSADLNKVPQANEPADSDLPALIDQFDARQALHVTFGSVLTEKEESGSYKFKTRLIELLKENEEVHYDCLRVHLNKHVGPLVGT